ncbi:DUF21 domain-containing protein At2g14520 isoform X1 [Phoenix dactylifera]|uniref:DUF21 domain-containing protein At2g14520 isoform X1 n=1 Tax=Phoenix dactylifera TaxID=42345 RepID=A0A8B7CSN6_PHODC|nr:DUF21 domain-containing protein At2g14520 isoform X1 [Phoenix dactylifera]
MAEESCCGLMFWVYLLICAALVSFAGLMSGLTLGLMSLSLMDLEVLVKAGQPEDRKRATKILPVVKNQHLLLCTLLIGNSLAMEALPIFLDSLVPAWGAILISVTLILAFGEIIPQAVCSRYGLSVGAKLAGVVRVLLVVFFPVSYPISKLLDWILGKGHFALMRRAELKTLVDMHGNEAGKGGELTHDETTIITGALQMTEKTARDAMTKISDTFSLDINFNLDMYTMGLIMTKGHSRVPIYSGSPTNIIGLILVKNLITCRPEDEVPIRNVTIRKIPRVYDDLPLYDILNEFQKGHSHMAVVVKHNKDIGQTTEKSKSNILENRMNQNRKHMPADGIPGDGSQLVLTEHLGVITKASPVNSNVPDSQSHVKRSNMEKHGEVRSQLKKSERGRHDNILDVNLDPLPSYSVDEEVIGIITMEDVMEELLQEEILDETDEYVDVHNKIKINMLPPGRSSPRSPGAAYISHFARRTPTASPLSPYHHTAMSRSPVSPNVQAAAPTSTISNSPGKSSPSSPANHAGLSHNSPASNRVSRKSYEKLQKNGESKD